MTQVFRGFWEVFQAQVDSQPEAVAIVEVGGQICSYLELAQQSLALASQLQQAGITAGQQVGIAYPRSIAFLRSVLALWALGAVWVPLDSELSADSERRQQRLQRAQICFVLSPETEASLAQWQPETQAAFVAVAANDPAYLIFTSGSTGEPKGVRLPHAGLVTVLEAQIKAFGLEPADRCFWLLSPLFDASISDWGCALLSGASLVIAPDPLRSLPYFYHLLFEQGISCLDLPPALLNALDPDLLPSSLKTLVIGGEAPPAEQVRNWACRFRLFNVYGPTEATICTSLVLCDSDWQEPLLGEPLPGVKYALAGDGKILPFEAQDSLTKNVGELWIAADGLALDYWQDPQLSAERFTEAQGRRWYRTRDSVRLRADGAYVFVGRLDRQFKSRGYLICPEEIEAALKLAGCQSAAVIEHPLYGLSAFFQGPVLLTELKQKLSQALPRWLRPQRWVPLSEWPLTASGKTDLALLATWRARPAIRGTISDNRLAAHHGVAEPDIKEALASIWWRLLQVWPEPEDDFFALGGHSIQVLSAVALGASEGFYLAPEWFYQMPTFAELCAHAEQARKAISDPQLSFLADLTQWSDRASLEAALPAAASQPLKSSQGKRILLTGASGFLGGRLLVDLLASGQSVTCLLRARDQCHARQRLQPLLEQFGLASISELQVQLVCCDLSQPQFGLSDRDYQRLIQESAAVVHCAAQVDLVRDRQTLWPVNVEALARIYDLGLPLHYISTLSVIASARPRPSQASESDCLEQTEAVAGGYAQSKWAAESWLLAQGRDQVWIYRPGLVCGDSRLIYQPQQDWFSSLIQGLLQIGALPELGDSDKLAMDIVPVDYVSAAIVHLMEQPTGIYHLANPQALSLNELWFQLGDQFQLKCISPADWLALVWRSLESEMQPVAAALLALCQALNLPTGQCWQSLNLFQATGMELVSAARVQSLSEQGLVCPPPQDLLMHYLRCYNQEHESALLDTRNRTRQY